MGSASPDVRLPVRGIAVTVSVCFCGGGFDSFLGFEYGVVITVLSRHTCSSTSSVSSYEPALFAHFLASLGSHSVTPHLSGLPSRFPHMRSLYWVFRLLWRSSELQLRWRRSPRRYSADSSASLAQCSFVGVFFSEFRDFRASFGSS